MKGSVVVLVASAAALAASPSFADARGEAKSQVEFGINVAQRGLWREAIYRWEKATQLDPTYVAAYNDLAIGYEHEGQLDKARKAYEKAIELDSLPLIEIAKDQSQGQNQTVSEDASAPREGSAPPVVRPSNGNGGADRAMALPANIKDEKDLEPYERLFANTAYWKRIGEEYQNPLIVTGTVLFTNRSTSGFVQRDQETFDNLGRRRVIPVRTYMERKGFILRPKFVFIDGRTGATMYSESYREEILYNAQQNTPALSSYFELMDRLVPNFLSALSSQKIRGSRVLLK